MAFHPLGCAGLVALTLAGAAAAQTPPAAAPPAGPPPPTCVAPKLVERMSVPAEDISHLESQANDYGHCMKAYIDARQAAADVANAQAKAEVTAGNAAATTTNAFFAAVKAYAAKHAKD